jgi:putative restriction endonuclease
MLTYFWRHTDELDIDASTRQLLWDQRLAAVHYPEGPDGKIGERDNESLDPHDYPQKAAQYIQLLNELAETGGYVFAEYFGQVEFLVGRVDPESEIEIIRGTWGDRYGLGGRPAVLKGLRLRDWRLVSRDDVADLYDKRPRRGTLRRWPKAGDAVAQLVEGGSFVLPPDVNQYERAYHAWNELADYARVRKTITYKQLGALIGIHFRAVRFALNHIYYFCLENRLPPLTALVVYKSGSPAPAFDTQNTSAFEDELERVYAFDWHSYGNPFAFAADGTTRESIVERLIARPEAAHEIYALTKVRGTAQMLFRDAILRAYGGQCAFTGSKITEGLEAAHLVPWAESGGRERLDVRNGILLTAWHHRLFDAGHITMDEDYRVRLSPQLLASASEFDRVALEKLDGSSLRLPGDPGLRPDPEYIRRRNELLGMSF